jgi:hypothetical protein
MNASVVNCCVVGLTATLTPALAQMTTQNTQRIRTGLRAAIRERFQLASAKTLIGESFPINHEARLVELANVEAGLRAELDMLHMLEDELVA